jgi:hypothetical protein
MSSLNVVFLIWDSCRADVARREAETLNELAESGVSATNAVAPAPWSHPSHTSIFSGEYPHEHGLWSPSQQTDATPLVDSLKESGYTCYGVSQNTFAGPEYGFNEPFDEFYETRGELFGGGLRVSEKLSGISSGKSRVGKFTALLREALTHDRRLASFGNISSKAALSVLGEYVSLPWVHSFAPHKNTRTIRQIVDDAAETDDPFFVFSNYMRTHRDFYPEWRQQRQEFGKILSHSRINELNELADPLDFVRRVADDSVNESQLVDLRSLYRGTVRSADDELSKLLSDLRQRDILDETLLVVTADHGENLGERDRRGRRRMGHQMSMSEHLLSVPLVVYNPRLPSVEIERHVSIKNVYRLLSDHIEDVTDWEAADFERVLSDDVVVSEYPALGDTEWYENNPDIDRDTIAERSSEDLVAGYSGEYRLLLSSDGGKWAWHGEESVELEAAPEELRDTCRRYLDTLRDRETGPLDIDERVRSNLEEMGYL